MARGAGPLGAPLFRAMWASTMVSQIGGFVQIVATSWAMTALTTSAATVALVQTAANLPVMLFAIGAGVLADLVERRSLMLAAQAMMLALSCALAAMAAIGALTPTLLLAFTFLIGCGAALHGPAWQASIGDLVPRRDVSAAVAANIVGNNIARSIGPAVGGLVVSIVGVVFAYALNALSYLGLLAVLWRWQPAACPRPRNRFGKAVLEGFGYALKNAAVRGLLVRAFLFSLGAAAVWGLMPLVAIRLGGGAQLLGLLFASFGLGAIGGAVASAMIRARRGGEAVARLGAAAAALAAGLLGLSTSVPLAVLAHLVAGAGWVSSLSTFNVSVQLSTPPVLVGRVLAMYQATAFGGLAIGSALWGVAADHGGVAPSLCAAGLFLAGAGIAGARLGLPQPLPEEA